MLALQILIACVLYAVCAGICYFITAELLDEDIAVVTTVFWPVILPFEILIVITIRVINLLKYIKEKIKTKRK